MISEAKLQATCYQWAYNTFKQVRGLLFSVPNGGKRDIREAQYLKATGVTPGIPDLLLLYNGVHGFEFKTSIGKISPAQENIHKVWEANGNKIYIIREVEDFKNLFPQLVKLSQNCHEIKFIYNRYPNIWVPVPNFDIAETLTGGSGTQISKKKPPKFYFTYTEK